jgi:hypothetical protein
LCISVEIKSKTETAKVIAYSIIMDGKTTPRYELKNLFPQKIILFSERVLDNKKNS